MSRMLKTATMAAFMAAAMGTAVAADNTVTGNKLDANQIRATDMKGATVYDAQNNKLGSIKDMVIGKDGRVDDVVIDTNGKYVAVPMQDMKIGVDQTNSNKPMFALNMTQQQLQSAPAFDMNDNTTKSGSSSAPAKENR